MSKYPISYPNIDMHLTGARLKEIMKANGLTVKELQQFLHLSCPQPVYRWFKGEILPSVDHLYMMSRLFQVHMETLLVPKKNTLRAERYKIEIEAGKPFERRICTYYRLLCA